MQDRGILYFATGAKYVAEAAASAASAKQQMPDVPVALVTDQVDAPAPFDQVVRIADTAYPLLVKVKALALTPFRRTVFLDSDTFVARPVEELFDLLADYDIAAAHAPLRLSITRHKEQAIFLGGVPVCFPEYNTGVVAYRHRPAVIEALEAWAALYERQLEGPVKPWTWDQLSFREIVYKSGLKLATLPNEYNYRLPFPQVTCGPVKILHGRHPNLANLLKRINQHRRYRVTVPAKFRAVAMFIADSQ
ncbi:MAG: hypothetical protein ACOY3L_18165 [Pseudomonadota bacterium]